MTATITKKEKVNKYPTTLGWEYEEEVDGIWYNRQGDMAINPDGTVDGLEGQGDETRWMKYIEDTYNANGNCKNLIFVK